MIKTEIKPEPLNGKRIGIASESSRFVDFDESSGFWFGDVKSACEFYLRYKDRPEDVWDLVNVEEELKLPKKEQKTLHLYLQLLSSSKNREEYIEMMNHYNEWLFKLAFRDVLEKGDNQ